MRLSLCGCITLTWEDATSSQVSDRVLCRENVPSRQIRLSGRAFHHDLLIWHRLCVA